MEWYRNDKAAVVEALRRGERPDLATTMASGPLDELVALHQDLGILAIVDELEVQRARAGVPDELRLAYASDLAICGASIFEWGKLGAVSRTRRVIATGVGPVQIRQGSNGRHRHPEGRQEESLPCHPDTDAAMRCGGWESRPGCMRKKQGSRRSTSGNWCVGGSMPSMAAGWATTFVWWPWCVCRRRVRVSWRGDS